MFGLSAGTAAAQPACPDVHWIGAAGSGERTGATSATDDGMGRRRQQVLPRLSRQLVQSDGRTITAEAVDYPATDVPADGGVGDWLGFMGSVDTGAAALASAVRGVRRAVPDHQGGAGRLLAGRDGGAPQPARRSTPSPNLAAALLIADGDRQPGDPTAQPRLGHLRCPGAGKGVAQDWPILAHAPAPLPANDGYPHHQRLRRQATRSATTTRTPRTSQPTAVRGAHQLRALARAMDSVDLGGCTNSWAVSRARSRFRRRITMSGRRRS